MFAEAAEKVKAEWQKAGREGEPRLVGLAYYSLGPDAEENANAYLRHYYAWLGEDLSKMIADSAAKDAETVGKYLQAYEQAGCDELIFFPSSSDSDPGRPARRSAALKPRRWPDDLPVLSFESAAKMEAWLERSHGDSDGIWLKIAKKGAGVESVDYAEALELALCFGWIDSQKRALDETHFLQRFTPRRPRGRWSRINRDAAEKLIAAGRMRPAGLAEVEAARADGRWDAAYEGQRTAKVPDDLRRELDRNQAAREFFAGLDSQNRYAILYRLDEAKKPETRERRLRKFVGMLERGETIH